MSQPHFINRIIKSVPNMKDARNITTPAAASTILITHLEGEKKKEHWSYRSLIGILNYLVNCTYPEMSLSVYQCGRFCNDPKYSHEQAVKRIIRYLIRTTQGSKEQGIIFRPDKNRSIDNFVDVSFVGEWNLE